MYVRVRLCVCLCVCVSVCLCVCVCLCLLARADMVTLERPGGAAVGAGTSATAPRLSRPERPEAVEVKQTPSMLDDDDDDDEEIEIQLDGVTGPLTPSRLPHCAQCDLVQVRRRCVCAACRTCASVCGVRVISRCGRSTAASATAVCRSTTTTACSSGRASGRRTTAASGGTCCARPSPSPWG